MPPPRGLVQSLDQSLHREPSWPPGSRLLIAVSGGADSVALLRLLHAINGSGHWNCTLLVGHIDHGLRGKESAGDGRFVKRLAADLQLPFMARKLKLPPKSGEDAARQGRLRALARMATQGDCRGVVMGHHADDQAETVLMKAFRGCGLDGLVGMARESRMAVETGRGEGLPVYRPLLGVRRDELRAYLESIGQPWREDSTNAALHFTRNRLRAEILPRIEAIWPGAVPALVRMSRIVAEAREPIDYAAQAIWECECRASRKGGRGARHNRLEIGREAFQTWPALISELLRRAIEHVGGTSETADWERITRAVQLIRGKQGGKVVEMGRGVVVRIGKTVVIERRGRRRP